MTEQHQDASKEGQPRDVVAAAVNIARAAQRAHSQASAASRKVDFIEELARRARDEADSLHDVASQLTATATSVAIIALETCRTDDERERLRQEVAATSDVPSANDAAIAKVDNFDSILSSLQIGHQLALPAESATGRHQQQPDGRDDTKNIERNKDTDTPSVSQQQDKSSVFIEQATPSPTTTKAIALVIQHAKEDAALESLRGCLKKSSDMLLDIDEVNTTVTGDKSSRHRKVGFESENSETDALTAELTKKEQQRRKLKPISLCKASVEPSTDSGVEATVGGFSPTLRGGAFSWVDNDCRQENSVSSVDSEVEDILNRQVCRLKTLDSVDPNYGVWTPSTQHRIHMVSPLLNPRERELYTVSCEDRSSVSPLPKHIFTPITSGSERSLSDFDDDVTSPHLTSDNPLDNECGDHPLANNMRPTTAVSPLTKSVQTSRHTAANDH